MLRHQRKNFITVILLAAIAALLELLAPPTVYKASRDLRIYVANQEPAVIVMQGNRHYVSDEKIEEIAAAYVKLLREREMVRRSLRHIKTIQDDSRPQSLTGTVTEYVVTDTLQRLSVALHPSSHFMTIRYDHTDPLVAHDFLYLHTEYFLQNHMHLQNRLYPEISKKQKTIARNRLNTSQQMIKKFMEKHRVVNFEKELSGLLEQRNKSPIIDVHLLHTMKQDLSTLRNQETELSGKRSSKRKDVLEVRKKIQQAEQSLESYQMTHMPTILAESLDRRISTLESIRDEYDELVRQRQRAQEEYDHIVARLEQKTLQQTKEVQVVAGEIKVIKTYGVLHWAFIASLMMLAGLITGMILGAILELLNKRICLTRLVRRPANTVNHFLK